GKRVVVYLGTLDPVRQIDILFGMLAIIKPQIPNILLVLAGDTEDSEHRSWLKAESEKLGLVENILWTGWLPMAEAWRYVVSAEVGLSPIPRGYLLDMGSPTKAVEYMALGIPVVMNDNPDQVLVAEDSGAAKCVPLTAENFARSVTKLLEDSSLRDKFKMSGLEYVVLARSYNYLAAQVAAKYHQLITKL
ncbi:MAG TPA: group 1 glycosyl transferase, partial [Methylophilaceae bacterium]|nr:group 1 glycosyl transferase [Methylophilaceae bacterium]